MMHNKIELKGFNTLKRLVGNQYGQEVYKTQIESSMKKDCKNVIIFPQQIEGIAMSFIEGMLDAMKSQVLRRDFYKYFDIQGNEKVIKKFQDVIFMGDD